MSVICRSGYGFGARLRVTGSQLIRYERSKRYTSVSASPSTDRRSRWRSPAISFIVGSVLGFGLYLILNKESAGRQPSEGFQQYRLESKIPYSATSSLFTLVPENVKITGLSSVDIKQPQLQISRQYTPLPRLLTKPPEGFSDGALQFWIRREVKGEVSNYLHNLPVGAIVELRGPKLQYEIPKDVKEILFLAGGTGIVPALQLAHALCDDQTRSSVSPRLCIFWANRRRDDCLGGVSDIPKAQGFWKWFRGGSSHKKQGVESKNSPIVMELESLKTELQGKLEVDYFVDEEATFIDWDVLRPRLIEPGSATAPDSAEHRRLILVCGPDGFVSHFAGPKQWQNKREVQGELGGILKTVKELGWDVWKL